MLRPGDTVRNYEIVAQLTTGGMGTLFVGRRVGVAGFVQPVAIKVIHPHLLHERRFRQAFIDEALLASRITHPNVVRVDELGEERGVYFLVMEYVHGCSLAELLQTLFKSRRGLSVPAAVAIAMRIANGLHAAHQLTDDDGTPLGLVHRDVSPQNILMGFSGQVKLCDFGIAKSANSRSGTGTGSLKGKVRYMSPEQAYGRTLDHRSDIYSAGLVLWEMLTRRRAFRKGEDLAVLEAVRNPDLPAPSTHTRGVPPELDAVVVRALAKNPDERFSSALDFARALGATTSDAYLVDSVRLTELLQVVLGDKIRRRTERLPSVLRSALAVFPAADGGQDFGAKAMTVTLGEEAVSDEARAFSDGIASASLPGQPQTQGSLPPVRGFRPGRSWFAAVAVLVVVTVTVAAATATLLDRGTAWWRGDVPKELTAPTEAVDNHVDGPVDGRTNTVIAPSTNASNAELGGGPGENPSADSPRQAEPSPDETATLATPESIPARKPPSEPVSKAAEEIQRTWTQGDPPPEGAPGQPSTAQSTSMGEDTQRPASVSTRATRTAARKPPPASPRRKKTTPTPKKPARVAPKTKNLDGVPILEEPDF